MLTILIWLVALVTFRFKKLATSFTYTNDNTIGAIIHRNALWTVRFGKCIQSRDTTVYRDDNYRTSIYWSWRVRYCPHEAVDRWKLESNETISWESY